MAKVEEKKQVQVNTDFTNFPDLLEQLQQMVEEDMTDNSKFIRKLIRQEWDRRHQPVLFEGTGIKVKSVVRRGKSPVVA